MDIAIRSKTEAEISHYPRVHDQDVEMKEEIGHEIFAEHVYCNKAPLWQGVYAIKQEEPSEVEPQTFFPARKVPGGHRATLRKKIPQYKMLNDDAREGYINKRIIPETCDNSWQPALEGQRGAFAACHLKRWELLGHYAGLPMTDEEYNRGIGATHATLINVDTYSFALPDGRFLSGYRYGNVTTLINANTTYKGIGKEKKYTANVIPVLHNDSDRWLVLLITFREIKKGEPLLLNYGRSYWIKKNLVIDLTLPEDSDDSDNDRAVNVAPSEESGILPLQSGSHSSLEQQAMTAQTCDVELPDSSSGSVCQIQTVVFDLIEQETGTISVQSKETEGRKKSDKTSQMLISSNTGMESHLCKISGTEFHSISSSNQHTCINSEETSLPVETCGTDFKSKSSLKIHKRIHSKEKSYLCEICGAYYQSKSGLVVHLRTHSQKNKPFPCELCSRAFNQKCHLEEHTRRRHTGEKQAMCEICQASFCTKYDLKIHMRRHTKEKPYKCDMCDAAFAHLKSIKWHKAKKHDITRYQCSLCSAGFYDNSDLRVHMLRHEGESPYAKKQVNRTPTDLTRHTTGLPFSGS